MGCSPCAPAVGSASLDVASSVRDAAVATPVQQTAPAAQTFDFKDPKGVNAIGFHLDSELEPIIGFASGITGTIDYDPSRPESFRGALELDAGKINTSNSRMTSVLQGADWIDLANHLVVRFDFDEVLGVDRHVDNVAHLWVKGRLSMAGVSQEKIVKVEATYLVDGAARRGGARDGNLLVLRSNFSVDRMGYGLKPEAGTATVARDIDLTVGIAGYSK